MMLYITSVTTAAVKMRMLMKLMVEIRMVVKIKMMM